MARTIAPLSFAVFVGIVAGVVLGAALGTHAQEATSEDVHQWVLDYALWYSSPSHPYDQLVADVLGVAACESVQFDANVLNNRRLGRLGEVGVGQWMPGGIWLTTPQSKAGYSVRDPRVGDITGPGAAPLVVLALPMSVRWLNLRQLLPGPWLETDIELAEDEWERPEPEQSSIGEVYERAPRTRWTFHEPTHAGLFFCRAPGGPTKVVEVYAGSYGLRFGWTDVPDVPLRGSGLEWSDREVLPPVEAA